MVKNGENPKEDALYRRGNEGIKICGIYLCNREYIRGNGCGTSKESNLCLCVEKGVYFIPFF